MNKKNNATLKSGISIILFLFFWSIALNAQKSKYQVKPIQTGIMASSTDAEQWFKDIAGWGVKSWECFAPHYRAQLFRLDVSQRINGELLGNDTTIPWLEELMPEFQSFQNKDEYQWQEAMILKAYKGCVDNNIDFNYGYPFPMFPVQDVELVRKFKPELFDSKGKFMLTHPFLRGLLKDHIRLLKRKLPLLKGVTVWMCEGNGELVKFDEEDLKNNKAWLNTWVGALSEVCKELNIQGTVFAHDYFHTNKTHRNVFEVLSKYPDIIIMEDNTWPEENTLIPPFAFMPQHDQNLLFSSNKVSQNCLTDSEYLGQGFYPSVFPRWWKKSVNEGIKKGVDFMNGRTFFWDRGTTDISFDRMNAYMLTQFCYTPDADPKEVLKNAVDEFLGTDAPNQLIEILFETEPMLQKIIGINGMSPLNHSGFPMAIFLDKDYMNNIRYMKAVDDLFQKPGTTLYVPESDDLDATLQWRVQNRSVSKSVKVYLKDKTEVINWLEKVLQQLPELTRNLPKQKAAFILDAYKAIYVLAKGMKLFVETGKVHYDWYRAKNISVNKAHQKFNELANKIQALAEGSGALPLNLKKDMLRFASDIRIITKIKPKRI
ncbi:hypothetical protein [Polaribacter sp. Hel_I_88]|uniref:hypothetical protein n=1 Tax=Polaribacter sp. Hel_I_88 TaxID=1250006 RepID=UPI000479F1AC|nr:hypothetical protein [Polaribacter sp. Hel_I_88]